MTSTAYHLQSIMHDSQTPAGYRVDKSIWSLS